MILSIHDIQVFIIVHMNSIAVLEGSCAGRVPYRASDSSNSGAIGPVACPFLHPIVVRIENIDRCVGHEDIGWRVQLIGGSYRSEPKMLTAVVEFGRMTTTRWLFVSAMYRVSLSTTRMPWLRDKEDGPDPELPVADPATVVAFVAHTDVSDRISGS